MYLLGLRLAGVASTGSLPSAFLCNLANRRPCLGERALLTVPLVSRCLGWELHPVFWRPMLQHHTTLDFVRPCTNGIRTEEPLFSSKNITVEAAQMIRGQIKTALHKLLIDLQRPRNNHPWRPLHRSENRLPLCFVHVLQLLGWEVLPLQMAVRLDLPLLLSFHHIHTH